MTDGQTVRGVIGVKVGVLTLTRSYYRIDETSHILCLSERKVREEVENGRLAAGCPNGARTKPLMVTAASIVDYYNLILIPADRWKE